MKPTELRAANFEVQLLSSDSRWRTLPLCARRLLSVNEVDGLRLMAKRCAELTSPASRADPALVGAASEARAAIAGTATNQLEVRAVLSVLTRSGGCGIRTREGC